jgi:hypothetical protein
VVETTLRVWNSLKPVVLEGFEATVAFDEIFAGHVYGAIVV